MDAGGQTIDTVRAGRVLARTLILVGGVVAATAVAWIAGDVTAGADTPIADGPSAPTAAATRFRLPDPVFAVASRTPHVVAEALIGRAAASTKHLEDAASPAASEVAADAGTVRHAAASLDVSTSRQPIDARRGRVEVATFPRALPVSNPDGTFLVLASWSGAGDAIAFPSSSRHKVLDDHSPPAPHPRETGHLAGEPDPPRSPLSACGTSPSLAVACGGEHRSCAVVLGCAARTIRISLAYGEFGHEAAQAAVIRPDATPG